MSTAKANGFKWAGRGLLVVYTLFVGFPIYWTLNTAFKPLGQIGTFPPTLYPKGFQLDAFVWVLSNSRAIDAILNSLIIASGTTILSVILGSLAGYAFSRFSWVDPGGHVSFWLLSTRMFPPVAVVLPIFFIYGRLGLQDTLIGLILLYLTFNLPLTTWLMRDFFDKIPASFEEAAFVDGYSRFQTFRKVVFPLVRPGLVATMMLAWVFAWNEFLFAWIITGNNTSTYTTIIPTLIESNQIQWNNIMAMATLVATPPTLILIAFRDNIIEGMTLGMTDI
ncbi:carbohydrate ABC transporter permease [Halobellus ruber]|uniref:Carbohydrate ABC transporter permease n=1 Tax=Halobellus ruber TaxID=2761102 RepID=A0A7J9SG55_9EURY|nr:carbohydrate ABC transporter permease [Halobellus ruber]MBB6645099.1 carbohydrate ABC transporter permease [Halobellus ruber]